MLWDIYRSLAILCQRLRYFRVSWQNLECSIMILLTLSPPNKSLSAKFLVCINFQSSSKSIKFGENFGWVTNSLDLGETPSYSASHPDSSCLHMEQQLCLAGYGLRHKQLVEIVVLHCRLSAMFFAVGACPLLLLMIMLLLLLLLLFWLSQQAKLTFFWCRRLIKW